MIGQWNVRRKAFGGDDNSAKQVCCACWESCTLDSESGPALVLCDGIQFRRLSVLSKSEECFELDAGADDRRVADFWLAFKTSFTLFMLAESGELGWARWLKSDTRASSNAARGQDSSSSCQSDFAGNHQKFACAAIDYLDGMRLCAVSSIGFACIVDCDGVVIISRQVEALRMPRTITGLPRAWAVLCGARDSASSVSICDLQSLVVCTTIDLQTVRLSHITSWGHVPNETDNDLVSRDFIAFTTSPIAVMSLCYTDCLVQGSSKESGSGMCQLPVVSDSVCVTSCAAFIAEPKPLVVCGLSDGTVFILRSIGSPTSFPSGFEICGKHSLATLASAAIVSCGFMTWSQPEVGGQLAISAATASGEHRLWISKTKLSRNGNTPSFQGLQMDRDARKDVGEGRYQRSSSSLAAPDGVEDDVQLGSGTLDLEMKHSVLVEHAELIPGPPRDELEMLIAQTTREIAELEREANLLEADDEQLPPPIPELAPLPGLESPAPPKIARLPRERYLDAKWVRAQRELVDPIEISRAYLDRACRPLRQPDQAYWVAPESSTLVTMTSLESTASLLSCDPLELHVKSLCQPW